MRKRKSEAEVLYRMTMVEAVRRNVREIHGLLFGRNGEPFLLSEESYAAYAHAQRELLAVVERVKLVSSSAARSVPNDAPFERFMSQLGIEKR